MDLKKLTIKEWLILRDMSTECVLAYWFANHIEMPLINHIARRGDVRIYNKKDSGSK